MADGPASTFDTDMARVRLVLMRELETISVYEALAREADSPEAKAFFEHLALEEKEHVAEATWLLRKLDPAQDADFEKQYSEAHFRGQPHAPSGGQAPAPNVEVAPPEAARSTDADLRPKAPYIPAEHRIPAEPRHTVHALPAPPSVLAGGFTVGPLKRRS